MNIDIHAIRQRALDELSQLSTLQDAATWEAEYLGPKGAVKLFQRNLGGLPTEERPAAGRAANEVSRELTESFTPIRERLESAALADAMQGDSIDVTLPGRQASVGAAHPITQMIDELVEVFALMGFQSVFGPEVETGRYNFDLLNIPADHPARDVWDTMIVQAPNAEIVMRTHTSPMQARTMERIDPPVRVIVPGKAYRFEDQDASHEWQFTQLEGLMVDKGVRLSDLKGVLEEMARQLFGPKRKVRFRCDFFPFVEPGVDFSVDCAVCDGKGCRVCKYTGWLEMGGAGMVHPQVLRGVGYDPNIYSGFAFGLGIERIIMMKYGVDDIRAFQANDLRFLRRFAETAV